MRYNVAIDGPAGAGKSTIAKIIGSKLGLMYINTGSMYRAVTYEAIEKEIKPNELEKIIKLIDDMDIYFNGDDIYVNGKNISNEIKMPYISNNVSDFAQIKEVREKLVNLQQKIASKYDVIMDGRDIGTVVLKDAKFKFYINASAEERSNRRYKELSNKGIDVNYNNILTEIVKRDYLDSNREISPLRKANDAIEIDTTELSIDDVVNKIITLIN
ncbi:(d)CMP kinase [Clostridium sp. DL1XJH146]